MIYFDSVMTKSTNTVVYFDWKTVIYITFVEYVAHNLCFQIQADDNSSTCTFRTGKSVTCTVACANEIIPEIPKHAGLTDKSGKNQFGLIKHWFTPDRLSGIKYWVWCIKEPCLISNLSIIYFD